MPIWETPFDPYNNNKWDNFNPMNVKKITKKHIDIYFPYDECWTCKLQYSDPLRVCFNTDVCNLRIKDVRMKNVVVTSALRGELRKYSIHMRSGLMGWLYKNECPIIFRPGNETGTVLHHKDENPFNNHWSNITIIDKHEAHHGNLRTFRRAIDKINNETINLRDARTIKKQVILLKNVYKYFQMEVTDSPRVFMIIELWNQYIKGNIKKEEAEKALIKFEAALPVEILREYDMRTIKYRLNQILDYEKNKESIEAIQHLLLLI
jgi:hypothetical protein